MGIGVAVAVGGGVAVAVAVEVAVGVAVEVGSGVHVGAGVGVKVGTGVQVGAGVHVGSGVAVQVGAGVQVGAIVGGASTHPATTTQAAAKPIPIAMAYGRSRWAYMSDDCIMVSISPKFTRQAVVPVVRVAQNSRVPGLTDAPCSTLTSFCPSPKVREAYGVRFLLAAGYPCAQIHRACPPI